MSPSWPLQKRTAARKLALITAGPIVVAAVILFSLLSRTVSADMVLTVTSTADNTTTDGQCTLREALGVVHGTSTADCPVSGSTTPYIIQFDSGVFDDGTTIELDPSLIQGYSHFAITTATPVIIRWTGSGTIVIDANASETSPGRLFTVGANADLTLTRLQLTGGDLSTALADNLEDRNGGAVRNLGTLSLIESLITDNVADHGGAIRNQGTLTVTDSTLHDNAAYQSGGGLHTSENSSSFLRSSVLENEAVSEAGGIYATGAGTVVDLDSTTISGNFSNPSGAQGGGIFLNGATLNMRYSTVSGNHAGNAAGGIIAWLNASLFASNSTISGNSSTNGAALLVAVGSTATLTNVTITNNTVTEPGHGAGVRTAISPTLNFTNVLIANNHNFGESAVHNCSLDSTNTFASNLADDTTCFPDLIDDNIVVSAGTAGLDALANNGGWTLTHRLLSGSPAIDTGDWATCTNPSGTNSIDQRGQPRAGGVCDIGAFELQASDQMTPTPTPTATATATATNTFTPVAPTQTSTPVPPTQTFTPVPPTQTFTPVPPTQTFTPVPPTQTFTPVPPTQTFTPVPPTQTFTPVPPTSTATATNTFTPVAPTSTPTLVVPTLTQTPSGATATPTMTVSASATRTPATPSPTVTRTSTPGTGDIGGPSWPGGLSLRCLPEEGTRLPVGASQLIVCVVTDEHGDPVPNVQVMFFIARQPGDDAAIGSILAYRQTDGAGEARVTLQTGSTPGLIVLEVSAVREFLTRNFTIYGQPAPQTEAPRLESQIRPPSTGTAGLAGY